VTSTDAVLGTYNVDTGGDGPVVVLLHGLLMDTSLWEEVIADLRTDHRCIAPVLPMGAHTRAMRDDADLSMPALARLVAEFIERLDLREVTLVGNDTGGALVQLLIRDGAPRVRAVVLASCDAFDNFPPGLTGKTLVLSGNLPPVLFGLFVQQLRLKPVRRLPIAFGWLTKRGDAATGQPARAHPRPATRTGSGQATSPETGAGRARPRRRCTTPLPCHSRFSLRRLSGHAQNATCGHRQTRPGRSVIRT
jgi:pimeloyl-ACP methyl ester carboxylesterase